MRRLALSIVLVLGSVAVAIVGPAVPAYACSCQAQTEQERFDAATLVFLGTAAGSEPNGTYTWTFDVEEVVKGETGPRVSVEVPKPDVEDCRFTLVPGERYEVFAYRDADVLRSGLCSGTRLLATTGLTPDVPKATPAPTPTAAPEPTPAPAPADATASPTPDRAGPSPSPATAVDLQADDGGAGWVVPVAVAALLLLGGATALVIRRRAG